MMTPTPYGFRIVGSTSEPRRLVDAGAAFAGYAACDSRAECHREGYLSAFQFGPDFRQHLESTGSTAGFSGPCWSPYISFDVDREDLEQALKDSRRLVLTLRDRYVLTDNDFLIFFSGSKGFHVGLPTALWSPAPSLDFHRVCRRFAESVAALATVTIDAGVYDRVRAFRAPNSRHPKTGLHKRRLSLDQLQNLTLDQIVELARRPQPFDVPHVSRTSAQAAADWQAASEAVAKEAEAKAARRAAGNSTPTLNRSTLDFIRNGADQGDRHRLLFSAAANLAEFGCPPALAHALLEESALDAGLPPKEVLRQIECGLAAVGAEPLHHGTPNAATGEPNGLIAQAASGAAASDSSGPSGQTCQHGVAAAAVPTAAELAALWGRNDRGLIKAESGKTEPPPAACRNPQIAIRAALPAAAPAPGEPARGFSSPSRPTPPPGAKLYFRDDRMQPCNPTDCYCWGWVGAPRWFYTAECPPPVPEREDVK